MCRRIQLQNCYIVLKQAEFIPSTEVYFKNSLALVPVQNDARPVVINDILKYLQENKEHCCLFEQANGTPSDPWVKRSGIKYVHLDNEMYYFFGSDAQTETVEEALKTSEGILLSLCTEFVSC